MFDIHVYFRPARHNLVFKSNPNQCKHGTIFLYMFTLLIHQLSITKPFFFFKIPYLQGPLVLNLAQQTSISTFDKSHSYRSHFSLTNGRMTSSLFERQEGIFLGVPAAVIKSKNCRKRCTTIQKLSLAK